jgi:hypothetical protein
MAVGDNDLNDPEDAFDATDPPRERLRNFIRRVLWIRDHLDDLDDPRAQDLLARLDRLIDDLNTLREQTG